jgi:uncharacterized membrane protein
MQLVGIALGVCAAIFWGLSDSLATLSARRLTTFQTTFICQIAALLALNVLFIFVHVFNPSITVGLSLANVEAGILTGVLTFVGYLAIYRALEIGPIVITSPLSSTSSLVTLLLSIFILHEHVSFPEAMALAAVILGIVLISTSYQDILSFLQKRPSGFSVSKGILWAYVGLLSLGCINFSLGARTPSAGWFAPIYWARIFSVLLLCFTAFSTAKRKGQVSSGVRTSNTGWLAPTYWTHLFSVLLFCTSAFYIIRQRGPKSILPLCLTAFSTAKRKEQISPSTRIANTGWLAPTYWTHLFSVLLFCTSAFYIIRQRGPKSILPLLQSIASLSEQHRGIFLAIIAGTLDGAALSIFGLATQIMQPGVITVITSNYTVVCVIFGICVLRERLLANQVFGLIMVMCGVAGIAYLHP